MSADSRVDAIARIASRYQGRWLQGYVRGKLRSDPIYAAGLALLRDSPLPVLDVGCGVGLFPCWLREHGCTVPVRGCDLDAAKIAKAQRATSIYSDVAFHIGGAPEHLEPPGNVVVFDVLQLLHAAQQHALLTQLAATLPPGGCCILRATLRDGSWRFWITRLEDWWLRVVRWMNSDAVHYPTLEEVRAPFAARGFSCETRPLWGRTPFNSHLFVFRRPVSE